MGSSCPSFLAPRTDFMEDNFSVDRESGNSFAMIQAHHIYCIFYFYYYYIVVYNEIIFTAHHNVESVGSLSLFS